MVDITTLNLQRLSSVTCLVSKWSSLVVQRKRKGYCYLAYVIRILLYFLNQSGFIVWLLKKYRKMIICCHCLKLR
ncbi:unnamed protein product [Lathyrus sativus]|nr:unnamed protein product [Lathyrus sativus]